ncbi:putative protein of unknown function (DUF563) [Lyophyllum shimeji]|uniref:Glycosyltransferase 61 catalytic domain-containing protein n=1 Tax=Lyophyllum shimeji TaxID=47721 RepID=A0A9P3PP38_LYOSH|nr:putative protein of unknown function (DUF563) [Lyophyllum shimeji]
MRRNLPYFVALVSLVGLYHLSTSKVLVGTENFTGFKDEKSADASNPKNTYEDARLTTFETTIPGGELVNGFSLLDRLYLRKGTFYIVTSNTSAFPSKNNIIARPLDIGTGHDLLCTDKELRFITPAEAKNTLGDQALPVDGFTLIAYDTEQFMKHFYHWWGEIIFGAWRVYSALTGRSKETTGLPLPSRVLLPHIYGTEWRDIPGINARLMRAAFPSTSIEKFDYWDDLILLDKTVVFERAMIISREAAHTHHFYNSWYKMISSTMAVNTSTDFWEPIRRITIQNVVGHVPEINYRGVVVSPRWAASEMPFVTYIVRQGGARRLAESDHEGLVKALKELEGEGICQVNVVQMEKMTLEQQIEVMARSTVVVGVHGNGLTHQLWMPPSARSTVIEIFAPGGYFHDYEILSRSLGRKHYAVWNDTLTTFPKGKYFEGVSYSDDFHGLSIPVHGPTVAQIIRARLTGPIPKD